MNTSKPWDLTPSWRLKCFEFSTDVNNCGKAEFKRSTFMTNYSFTSLFAHSSFCPIAPDPCTCKGTTKLYGIHPSIYLRSIRVTRPSSMIPHCTVADKDIAVASSGFQTTTMPEPFSSEVSQRTVWLLNWAQLLPPLGSASVD